ncbi:ATP-binding protein [Limibacillus sp. MBR-115]|uniref:ATP-binding protein n=1 Tax=Limibacillus sp. MBR-115 TaxID=3156465 RepID=UPI003399AC7E
MTPTQKQRRQRLLRHWLGTSAVFSAPFVLASAALVVAGSLAPSYAAATALLATGGVAALLYRHFSHIAELQDYVEALGAMGLPERGSPGQLPPPPSDRGGKLLATGLADVIVAASVERQKRRAELQAALNGNQAILSSLPDPLILLDEERRVVRMNPAAQAIFGERLLNRDISSLLRNPTLTNAVDRVLAGGEEQVVTFPITGKIDRHMIARVVRLNEANLEGSVVLLTLHDVTGIKRAERMRADFVANASHELRTPLSSLIGFLETLRGPAADDAEARDRFLGIMHDQAVRMSRLVSDLMSLSRIEMEEHTQPTAAIEVGAVLDGIVNGLQIRAGERQITVDCTYSQLPAVVGDTEALTQIFQNLIENALKYGRKGSHVRIEAWPVGDGTTRRGRRLDQPSLAISVIDQGEGIPREHLPRLTERFYRVDPARSRELGGTGLGLAIVKHLVNRHRGLLEIESELGKGSSFTVYLPLAGSNRGSQAAE